MRIPMHVLLLVTVSVWSLELAASECLHTVGQSRLAGDYHAVSLAGSEVLVADAEHGLRVLSPDGDGHIRQLAVLDVPGRAVAVVAAGDHAYLASLGAGIFAIDISNPGNPVIAGLWHSTCPIRDIAMRQNLLFVACLDAGLKIVDFSEVGTPRELASVDTPGLAYGVAVSGSHAFVADFTGGLRVIDISDPGEPHEVGSSGFSRRAIDVAVGNGFAYVADAADGVYSFEITNPAHPEVASLISVVDSFSGIDHAVDLWGDTLFIAHHQVWPVDVHDPTAPVVGEGTLLANPARDLRVSPTGAVVVSPDGGLVFLEHHSCSTS